MQHRTVQNLIWKTVYEFLLSDAYLRPYPPSIVELLAKLLNGGNLLTIFTKNLQLEAPVRRY